jgi:hypothetical protein
MRFLFCFTRAWADNSGAGATRFFLFWIFDFGLEERRERNLKILDFRVPPRGIGLKNESREARDFAITLDGSREAREYTRIKEEYLNRR